MVIKGVRIRRNGEFLNAWFNGQFFMEAINPENPKESSKKLLERIIHYKNETL